MAHPQRGALLRAPDPAAAGRTCRRCHPWRWKWLGQARLAPGVAGVAVEGASFTAATSRELRGGGKICVEAIFLL